MFNMTYNDVIFGTVSCDEFAIDERELSARLGFAAKVEDYTAKISLFNSTATYKFAYIRLPIELNEDECDFGFYKVKSASLSKVLQGSKEAIVFAVSCGIDTDRLISRLYLQSSADAYLCDAIGSAMVESLADFVNEKICNGLNVTNRFSPGYADFPIEFQAPLLNRLDAYRTVGISLTDDLLMIPMKSITAVIGIK